MPGVGSNPNWPAMKVSVDFTNPAAAAALPSAGINGTFDTNITGWSKTPSSTAIAYQTATTHDGGGAMQITFPNDVTAFNAGALLTSQITNLIPGAVYNVSVWVNVPTGQNSGLTLQVDDVVPTTTVQSTAAVANSTWQQLSVNYTVPANGQMEIRFLNANAVTSGWVAYVDTLVIQTIWTDITQYCRRTNDGQLMHLERGRNYERAQTDAGTCTVVLDNSTGVFDSTNSASPFYPNVKPIRRMKVEATWTTPAGTNIVPNGTFDTNVSGWEYHPASLTDTATVSRSTSTVHTGTGSMSVAWTSNSSASTIPIDTPNIAVPAGQTYTISFAYFNTGTTQPLFEVIDPATSTVLASQAGNAASGSWQTRSGATFVAPASGQVFLRITNFTATTSGDVTYMDDIVITNVNPISVLYPIFYGFMEDWPRVWSRSGFWGEVSATARGIFSSLSNVVLNEPWVSAAIADGALAIYRLNDSDGYARAANSSSFQQNFATIQISSNGNASNKFQFGGAQGSGNLGGSPSSGLDLSPLADTSNRFTNGGYYLQTASASDSSNGLLFQNSINAWSFECWFLARSNTGSGSAATGNCIMAQMTGPNGSNLFDLTVENQTTSRNVPGSVQFWVAGQSSPFLSTNTVGYNYWDNQWHHVVITALNSGGNTSFNLYVDGVPPAGGVASATVATSSWAQNGLAVQNLGWDGVFPWNGSLKNAAWYNTALSAAQVQNHFNAGAGYNNDDTGTRLGRLLTYGPYTQFLLDTGDSFLGPANHEGKNLVQAMQDANDTEVGTLVEDGLGNVVFKNRQSRGGQPAVAVFGEAYFPYEDGITFQQDAREIYTTVVVTPDIGGQVTNTDTAAQNNYFSRTLNVTSEDVNLQQSVYLSEYQLWRYKTPHDRIPNLTLRPSANPALWPQALGRKVGDRVTVTRNNPGAPGISEDFYIDKITHDVSVGEWKTTFMLSSATLYDTWILGDSTFGVLGSTTILGF